MNMLHKIYSRLLLDKKDLKKHIFNLNFPSSYLYIRKFHWRISWKPYIHVKCCGKIRILDKNSIAVCTHITYILMTLKLEKIIQENNHKSYK